MGNQDEEMLPPHILIFPFPIQGHVNSMIILAELLCLQDLHITFIVSHFSHDRLLKHTDVESRFGKYNGFQFQTISDGLPEDHPRSGERVMDVLTGTKNVMGPEFERMMIENDYFCCLNKKRPISCVIADGILSFAGDFAVENGIPLVYFRTVSACSFWACFCMPEIIEAGDIPIKGNGMDMIVNCIPGMENFLRRRDLPGFCRVNEINDPILRIIKNSSRQTTRAQAFILNTFEHLESPILSQIRKHMPRTYSIGPSHTILKSRLETETVRTSSSSSSFWEEDRSCIAWLDTQPSKSVLYVSFGSITVVTGKQLLEFWHGLVNSGQRFLWVVRPDSVNAEDGDQEITNELKEGTKARGYMVGWAPQVEVLNHPAVGGFLTHSGWNSTLESIMAGIPMLCWPYMVDQMINSRFVSEIWNIGLDMKDTCDKTIIERMVKELMVVRKDEFLANAKHMAKKATKAVNKGGSSYSNMDDLVEFLWSLVVPKPKHPYF